MFYIHVHDWGIVYTKLNKDLVLTKEDLIPCSDMYEYLQIHVHVLIHADNQQNKPSMTWHCSHCHIF